MAYAYTCMHTPIYMPWRRRPARETVVCGICIHMHTLDIILTLTLVLTPHPHPQPHPHPHPSPSSSPLTSHLSPLTSHPHPNPHPGRPSTIPTYFLTYFLTSFLTSFLPSFLTYLLRASVYYPDGSMTPSGLAVTATADAQGDETLMLMVTEARPQVAGADEWAEAAGGGAAPLEFRRLDSPAAACAAAACACAAASAGASAAAIGSIDATLGLSRGGLSKASPRLGPLASP